jgi:tetratricopeptide (TPR) repeat protein
LRVAIRLAPNYADAHAFLGMALESTGHLDEAIVSYRTLVRLRASWADPYPVLAAALRKKGQFAESLAELRRGHKLALKAPPHLPQSPQYAQWVREAERLVELDARLPAILGGSARPTSAAECIELANLCTLKKLPGRAAGFYEEAFAAQPGLADDLRAGHRYNAACTAALAGCGQGQDSPLRESARARWRQQAVAWLRADLALWAMQLASDKPEDRGAVRQALEHWQRDSDLAGVRDQAALARLPQTEHDAWRKLWARVQQRLDEARGRR